MNTTPNKVSIPAPFNISEDIIPDNVVNIGFDAASKSIITCKSNALIPKDEINVKTAATR